MVWLLVVGITLLFLLLLILIPIKTDLHFHRQDGKDKCTIRISFGGLFHSNIQLLQAQQSRKWWQPLIHWVVRTKIGEFRAKEEKTLDPTEWSLDLIRLVLRKGIRVSRTLLPALHKIIAKTEIRHLSWRTTFGTGDAASTGVLAGVAWSLKGSLVGWLLHQVKKVKTSPQLKVIPQFSTSVFSLEFHCIFVVRAGHIIVAGTSAFWRARQRRG
ncbi:MAG TPA: DUF2953 domain-containing protein [Bacillota bacterium]|nr:DUF2953 domain-containing protein [Bacillota bacterium]